MKVKCGVLMAKKGSSIEDIRGQREDSEERNGIWPRNRSKLEQK